MADKDISLRFSLVLWKTVISACLSSLSVWVILSSPEIFDGIDCFDGLSYNLCAFKSAAFAFSVVLNAPLLVESLYMNKVFFVWIIRSELLSDKTRETAKYYFKLAARYHLINFDEEEFNVRGREILDRVIYNITKRKSWCERVLGYTRSLFSIIIAIPLFWIFRFTLRAIQTIVMLPCILIYSETRKEFIVIWRNLILLPLLMLSDPICVLLLFPLSFVAIFSADSIQECFLNLVAVQVFAQIDDEFVNNAFHPSRSLTERADIYYSETSTTVSSTPADAV